MSNAITFSLNTQTTLLPPKISSKTQESNSSQTGPPFPTPHAALTLLTSRKCSNLLPGTFNKACSAYFGGHYHDLYSGSSDEEIESRFTTRKAMTFLRRARQQKFLAERKVGEWSFPCEVVGKDGGMQLKQWIPEGGEEDFVEPEFKDEEIVIFLEDEIMEFVYVYVSPSFFCGRS